MSNVRRIHVPAAIFIVDLATDKAGTVPQTFFDWACGAWFNDVRWQGNMARLISTVQAFRKIRGVATATALDLAEDDWRILCEVAKQPQPSANVAPQQPLVAIQFESYKAAVLDAKAVAP